MQTDARGTFAFSEIVPGPYVLRVAMDGYASDERQIDLTEDTSLALGLRPAVDLKGLITGVQTLEAETLRRFNTAVAEARAGRITGDQFSRIVKKELLPPWERRRAELAELKLTPDQHRVTASVISYMQLRGESWGLLADGVRTNNTALIKLSQRKHDAAMAEAKKMGEVGNATHGRGNTER